MTEITIELPKLAFAFVLAMGIPSGVCGLLFNRLEKRMDKKEAIREEKEANTEKLIHILVQSSRASMVLVEATARAVQRIPDAKCNGDMTTALKRAEEIQKAEQEFLYGQGIKHIFGD